MKGTHKLILLIFIAAGAAAAAFVLTARMKYEASNRSVEIVVDYADLLNSLPMNSKPEFALSRLESIGVTTIGVYEETLQTFIDKGRVRLITPGGAFRAASPGSSAARNIVFANDLETQETLGVFVRAYFGREACPRGMRYCIVPLPQERFEDVHMGLPPLQTKMAVAPRLTNSPFDTPETVKLKIRRLEKIANLSALIFEGDKVLGHRKLLGETAEAIRENNLLYGWIELVPQEGADTLKSLTPDNVLAVHSIAAAELEKLSPQTCVERFARAARERGVRVLFIHLPVEYAGKSRGEMLDANFEYLKRIIEEVEKAGFEPGRAAPVGAFKVHPAVTALVFGGMAAFCVFMLSLVFTLPGGLAVAVAAAAPPVWWVASQAGMETPLSKLAALAVACVVPGIAVAASFLKGRAPDDAPRPPLSFGETATAWLQACILTILGGIFVAAILSSREFFIRIDSFSGVKLAYALPLAAIVALYYRWSGITLSGFFKTPFRYAEVAVIGLLLGVIGIYLLRSGNDAPAVTSGFEREFRSWLEALLVVRPRTKEFLIGHPALMVGAAIPFARGAIVPIAFLLLGVMAQVSIMNTFCHLHTPFALSLARVLMGVALGAVIGFPLRWIAQGAGIQRL